MVANYNQYPNIPHRPNFTDIRTMQIFDPVLTKTTSATAIGTTFTQVHAAGATLENGVRIKCIDGGTDKLLVGLYDPITHTGTTGDGGFELADREEVFIEVRQLSHLWVKSSANTNGYTVIAS